MITCIDRSAEESVRENNFFADKNVAGFIDWQDLPMEKNLEHFVFQVAKKPASLPAHMKRIYLCFENHLSDQLCGALLDLLIILENKGQALARRMVFGSKARLSVANFQALSTFLDHPQFCQTALFHNRFSLFAKGLLSTAELIGVRGEIRQTDYDPLILARDFIEFSQIDEAVQTLIQAISVQPGRLELHEELLGIYQSTRNKAAFKQIYEELTTRQVPLPPAWEQVMLYFDDLNL